MPSIPVTRRRFLLSTAAVVALAGCSGAPGGSGEADDADTTVDGGPSTDPSPSDVSPDSPATSETPTTSHEDPTDTPASGSSADGTQSSGSATETGTADGELDLREANVVDVEFDDSSRFDVTLYHDDDGEDGYANWWQVETLDGERLGRRELLHAHGTRPFTRSASIAVPDGTAYVVVRGHDQTHGYGGQAMVVDLDTGATEAVRQGPEPRDFSGYEPNG
jgi:hypothetical protein